jgi:hypothetical protein
VSGRLRSTQGSSCSLHDQRDWLAVSGRKRRDRSFPSKLGAPARKNGADRMGGTGASDRIHLAETEVGIRKIRFSPRLGRPTKFAAADRRYRGGLRFRRWWADRRIHVQREGTREPYPFRLRVLATMLYRPARLVSRRKAICARLTTTWMVATLRAR